MSMTIGRCAITRSPAVGSLRQRGDEVSFRAWLIATDVDEFKARVQQLRGLMNNPDEDVFPFTWSEDSSFDGFYTDFDVEVEDSAVMLTTGVAPFRVRMRRVGGFTAPQVECIATSVTATNAHGLPTSAAGLLAVPASAPLEITPASALAGGIPYGFTSTRGVENSGGVYTLTGSLPASPFSFGWATTPRYYYEGSAKLEREYGGTYYPTHGQQVGTLDNQAGWRISNGIVRVSMGQAARIDVSHRKGTTTWDTAVTWNIGAATVPVPVISAVVGRVIRNTPELVVVRCIFQASASTYESLIMDISLRRGARWASFSLTSTNSNDWYVERASAEAGTALTGGFRATSTDASGNRYVVGGLAAQTNTLASGRLKLTTAATSFQFVIGSEVSADGTGQTVINEFATAISENHRVVVR